MQKETKKAIANASPAVTTRAEYVALYGPYVMEALKDKPLFASLMMAQAILESASIKGVPGGSSLAAKYNNHFGIKADAAWKGERVALNTREYVNGEEVRVKAWFRVYDHAHGSFDDRIAFLIRNKRYQKAGVFTATSPKAQAEALQHAGYATDPRYAVKLVGLIEKLRLSDLDKDKVVPPADVIRPPVTTPRGVARKSPSSRKVS